MGGPIPPRVQTGSWRSRETAALRTEPPRDMLSSMPLELPAYMRQSNVEAVREECAPYRDMSFEERARLAELDDRLPVSTVVALARLRRHDR